MPTNNETPTAEDSRALLEKLTGYTPCPDTYRDREGNLSTTEDFAKANANARLIADLVAHLRAALDREAFWKRDSARAWDLFWGHDY